MYIFTCFVLEVRRTMNCYSYNAQDTRITTETLTTNCRTVRRIYIAAAAVDDDISLTTPRPRVRAKNKNKKTRKTKTKTKKIYVEEKCR